MTGKPYSIKEMKAIVDYLTENKFYGEIKGRKMWMDYAKSQFTTRTWQSLKEAFLKRILPDIHNPYYKLSIEQINSFRSGCDINAANKNKLEIHTVSDDSDGPQNLAPQTSNGNAKKQDDNADETMKSSKVTLRSRSSADTVIVDTCYETADDIKKDLEEASDQIGNGQTKSLRDCITYSEPLTPMLQEVIDDFQSEPDNEPESSDREYPLQIVETPDIENLENISNEVSKILKENQNNEPDQLTNASEDVANLDANTDVKEADPKPTNENPSNSEKTTSISKTTIENDSEIVCLNDSEDEKRIESNVDEDARKSETTEIKQPVEIPHITSVICSETLNNSTTPDASLPNNPEALKKRISNENQNEKTENNENQVDKTEKSEKQDDKTEMLEKHCERKAKVSKKRLNIENGLIINESKNLKIEHKKIKANSECESNTADKAVVKTKAKSVEPIQKINEPDELNNKAKTHSRLDVLEKPSTSKGYNVRKTLVTPESDQNGKVKQCGETNNPRLKNTSMFDKTKYNYSESSDMDQSKTTDRINTDVKTQEKQNEVVLLKSHTESDNSGGITKPPMKKRRAGVERDSKIANVFGFSSGASRLKRKRKLSHRRRTISQNIVSHNNGDSDSSEWTSESDSEQYISPPRGRRNRQTKKYLKPQSARIHSLEEEGGLFVMYGKKIYPVVKDGKLLKNYLTYQPDSESDEENYWKLKYVEEKKKLAVLTKKLQQHQLPRVVTANTSAQTSGSSPMYRDQPQISSNIGREIYLPPQEEKKLEQKSILPENIKIKFTTKHDQEIHLEGNWQQLQNALEHVVHIFHKEPQPFSESKPQPVRRASSSSGIPSPIFVTAIEESEIHEKVDKIEHKIFKEIEEIAMQEQEQPSETENVTKRKGGPPKLSSPAAESPAKRIKLYDQQEESNVQEVQENNSNNTTNTANESSKQVNNSGENEKQTNDNIPIDMQSNVSEDSTKMKLRTPRKVANERVSSSETKTIQTRRSKPKLDVTAAVVHDDEEEVRYMLPPENKRNTKSTDRKTKQKFTKSLANPPTLFSTLEISCGNSMESTQGYQDSDPSPVKNEHRKKKRLNIAVLQSRNISHLRRSARNRQSQFLYYNDSSISNIGTTNKKDNGDNTTINTEVYRSESYQLLMPPAIETYTAKQELSPIRETHQNSNDVIKCVDPIISNEVYSVEMTVDVGNRDCAQSNSDIGSTSNMSLPISPELSVVESLSISQELLNTIDEDPGINEIRCNENIPKTCSQFLMSGIDASIPLMQQANTLENSHVLKKDLDCPKNVITESLLKKVKTFTIKDKSNLTDLDLKLRDLLLDSAKKIATKNHNMEVDETNIELHEQNRKPKQKKRCSTPRKRKNSQNPKKAFQVHDLIEEEHKESYSQSGRQSCPPIIESFPIEASIEDEEIQITNLTIAKQVQPKTRKKKDIIKVKITKPMSKKSQYSTKKQKKDFIKDNITESICNDIALNDTESGVFLTVDESIDLIHNHSETCLQTNECISESVEFVENSMKSVFTLTDSTQCGDDISWHSQCEFNDLDNNSPDFLCNDARDMQSFYKAKQDALNTTESVYHSPHGTQASSLMTDDLSDDLPLPPVRCGKWYLLSDDDTTHNIANTTLGTNIASLGANLKQIFPVACAVPDLSTITEGSRENDEYSRKSTRDGFSIGGSSSQSIFDSV